jgi:alpha-amylase
MLVLLTNRVSGTITKHISYHPYTNGQIICNVFYPTTDCITVNNGFAVYLVNGEVKIYVPK